MISSCFFNDFQKKVEPWPLKIWWRDEEDEVISSIFCKKKSCCFVKRKRKKSDCHKIFKIHIKKLLHYYVQCTYINDLIAQLTYY